MLLKQLRQKEPLFLGIVQVQRELGKFTLQLFYLLTHGPNVCAKSGKDPAQRSGGLNARVAPAEAMQGTGTRYFPETGQTVKGRFLQYWNEHGGLSQQGFPLTEEFVEVPELNGGEQGVQYFEGGVSEMQPENLPPNDRLLSK